MPLTKHDANIQKVLYQIDFDTFSAKKTLNTLDVQKNADICSILLKLRFFLEWIYGRPRMFFYTDIGTKCQGQMNDYLTVSTCRLTYAKKLLKRAAKYLRRLVAEK